MTAPLWSPSPERIAATNITAFRHTLEHQWRVSLRDYAALYQFSVDRPEAFWSSLWDFTGIRGVKGGRVTERFDQMPGARFFPDARLNFAENLLRHEDGVVARRQCLFSSRRQGHLVPRLPLPSPYHRAGFAANRQPDGTFGLSTDWWDGHVEREVGPNYGRLLQLYAVHKATREARKHGLTVHRTQRSDGSIKLCLS